MRLPLPVLLASAVALSGCGVDCGTPDQINGTYAVFSNVFDYDGTNLEAFPSYQDPTNGWSEWSLGWNRLTGASQNVTIAIDGEEYTADGVWNDIECGNFQVSNWQGTYVSEIGSEHTFQASGEFVVFADQLQGTWDWSEDWTAPDGATGTYTASGQISGNVVGGGD